MIKIEINNITYNVDIADTEESMAKGLQGVKELPQNQGMLFVYDEPQEVSYWMKDTLIPLDIVFIDEDWEVISKYCGKPESEDFLTEQNVMYVLELNEGSKVGRGDDVDLSNIDQEDEEILDLKKESEQKEEKEKPVMLVIGDKGKVQMELKGGERIFSRKNTKVLVRIAKKAYKSKLEKDYKMLGRIMFKYLKIQNEKDDDFVELPEK